MPIINEKDKALLNYLADCIKLKSKELNCKPQEVLNEFIENIEIDIIKIRVNAK